MKNVCLYICFLLSINSIVAQDQENNNWALGQVNLNFSNTPPTANISTITDTFNSGNAAISDENGDLLFYTNGEKVWNKNHQVMPNGDIVVGSPESDEIHGLTTLSQKVIIVPHPQNPNQYFIINHELLITGTVGVEPYGGYYYSIVDFTNNSLGEVIDGIPSALDVNENHKPYYSPLTYTGTATGDGYWIIVQEGDRMLSYKIDENGFNSPAVQTFFPENTIYNYGSEIDDNGTVSGIDASMIRIVPDYSNPFNMKLYGLEFSGFNFSHEGPNSDYNFYSLDFNSVTGEFSNYTNIDLGNVGILRNFEFSSDYKKVYFTLARHQNPVYGSNPAGQVMVKDLTALSTPARTLNLYNTSTPSTDFSYLQKDRYGNLLVSSESSTNNRNQYFHIIEDQNSFSNSSVKTNYVYLQGKVISRLPQLIQHIELSCIPAITLSTVETNNNYTYKYGNIITTNGSYAVNSGTNITFKAGDAIYWKTNTHIKTGSNVVAKIEECFPIVPRSLSKDSETSFETDTPEVRNQSFTMYPNPANESTTVQLKDGVIQSVNVTSMEGFTVFSKDKIGKESFELYVPTLRRGIYVVTIQTEDGKVLTEKLMKN